MDIRNCVKCGKIYNYINGIPMCPTCKSHLEDQFQVTKKYIRDNPSATIVQISEECEVPIKLIHQWIREERLIFSKDSQIGIECEICGSSIRTGRFCDVCKHDLHNNLDDALKKQTFVEELSKRREENKMWYLDRK
ncbi:MAG: flagellar protein [Vallitalea sp.]|jgi:flagellar operon protein (TIGR03826 family)|nr:flagellar protein [Vallitalea sp.]